MYFLMWIDTSCGLRIEYLRSLSASDAVWGRLKAAKRFESEEQAELYLRGNDPTRDRGWGKNKVVVVFIHPLNLQ